MNTDLSIKNDAVKFSTESPTDYDISISAILEEVYKIMGQLREESTQGTLKGFNKALDRFSRKIQQISKEVEKKNKDMENAKNDKDLREKLQNEIQALNGELTIVQTEQRQTNTSMTALTSNIQVMVDVTKKLIATVNQLLQAAATMTST